MIKKIRIATRASKLALWQSNWVKSCLEEGFPDLVVELIHLKTKGDKILDVPLAKIGGKGLFVKELETALLENKADIAVHSLKDVPTEFPEGLEISVITRRETPNDAFVSNRFGCFEALPQHSVLGTSSLRRIAQLKKARPDIRFESLRGNVNTRLKKLDNGEFDGIILAAAGLIRLGLQDRLTEILPYDLSLPAIGQGVVCIESRKGDMAILERISPLADAETTMTVSAERALLKRLNGGCQIPIAGHAVIENRQIHLTGVLASPDGDRYLRMTETGPLTDGAGIGTRLGQRLLEAGGREILAAVGIETD
ncbi:hydroxymethylbilane synthase [bacterium]|nr:hydroxymethylbilane synthase [bacterium]